MKPAGEARGQQGRLPSSTRWPPAPWAVASRACRAHEHVVVEGGLTEEQVHDAVRIAATVHAAAIALEVAF